MPAQAVLAASDPIVDVLVDATSPACVTAFSDNVGTLAEKTVSVPCAPYTWAHSETMRKSEAVAKHEAYVLYPGAGAPTSAWEARLREQQQILSQKRMANRPGTAAQAAPLVVASCTQIYRQFENWPTYDGDKLDNLVSWFSASDCTHVYIQTGRVKGLTSPHILYIFEQEYDTCCPFPVKYPNAYVGTNTITIPWPGNSAPYPKGSDFWMAFTTQVNGGGDVYWDLMGTLT